MNNPNARGPTATQLNSGEQPTPERRAFFRRRNHSNITAQTGRILQALGYPARRLRDLVDAVQSAHGAGADAEAPFTPFARSHLTIAEFMDLRGKPESNIAVVSRALAAHKRWQQKNGRVLIDVISPTDSNEVETTTYIDHLTPFADESFQRALSSELWRQGAEGKRRAIAESVKWAIARLPRAEPEPEPGAASAMALADYAHLQKIRIELSAEKVSDKIINEYHSDEEAEIFYRDLARDLAQKADSIRKTRRARYAQISDEAETPPAGESTDRTMVVINTTHVAELDTPDTQTGGHAKQSTPPLLNPNESSDLIFQDVAIENIRTPDPEPAPDVPASALAYPKLGFAVFPLHSIENGKCDCGAEDCPSPGKHPRTPRGVKDASKDPAQIRRWWKKWPNANIGIATGPVSGVVVMDVDFKNGGDAGLGELVERVGDLPDTYTVRTGNGWHFYFADSAGDIRNSAHKLGEGLDVRGAGGYVVAPPSLHYSGKRYEMASEFLPAPIPPELRALMVAEPEKPALDPLRPRRQTTPAGRDGRSLDIPGGLRDGDGRNEILFRKVACRARFFGASEAEILEKLEEANAQYCADPVSYTELRKIAASAVRYAPGAHR